MARRLFSMNSFLTTLAIVTCGPPWFVVIASIIFASSSKAVGDRLFQGAHVCVSYIWEIYSSRYFANVGWLLWIFVHTVASLLLFTKFGTHATPVRLFLLLVITVFDVGIGRCLALNARVRQAAKSRRAQRTAKSKPRRYASATCLNDLASNLPSLLLEEISRHLLFLPIAKPHFPLLSPSVLIAHLVKISFAGLVCAMDGGAASKMGTAEPVENTEVDQTVSNQARAPTGVSKFAVSESGCAASTFNSGLHELKPIGTTLSELRATLRSIAAEWGIPRSPDVVEAALSLICEAECGSAVLVGLEDDLRSIIVRSSDDGYMDRRMVGLGIGSPELRQAFVDFTSKKYDDHGHWASSYSDTDAHRKSRKGTWIFSANGGFLKAASILLGGEKFNPAPYKLTDKGDPV